MTYEEKRELRLQISQLLADAGLNQQKIKEIVEEEIKNKVDRAVNQKISQLNSECYSGDYIKKKVDSVFETASINYHLSQVVKEELKNRVIQIVLKDCKNGVQ